MEYAWPLAKKGMMRLFEKYPNHVLAFRQKLAMGRINGRSYFDNNGCGCAKGTFYILEFGVPELVGTNQFALVIGSDVPDQHVFGSQLIETKLGIEVDEQMPEEAFFIAIERGDTPKNNNSAAQVDEWIAEFLRQEQEETEKD